MKLVTQHPKYYKKPVGSPISFKNIINMVIKMTDCYKKQEIINKNEWLMFLSMTIS